jgi:hypothetical protein
MPSPFIDFRNIRYHFYSTVVIGSKPVFVTTEASVSTQNDASNLGSSEDDRYAPRQHATATHSSFVSSFQFSQRPANAKGSRSRLAIA